LFGISVTILIVSICLVWFTARQSRIVRELRSLDDFAEP
jgi:hypothetical protein